MRRHLAYHCYPVAGNGVWQWNVDQIRRRLDVFTGRLVVAVVTDDTTDTAAAVRDRLGVTGVEWLELPNDRQRGEGATWVPLWERLQGEPGVTFRAHAKGVTAKEKCQTVRVRTVSSKLFGHEDVRREVVAVGNVDTDTLPTRVKAMRVWADAMYRTCLDRVEDIDQLLIRHPMVGPFKQETPAIAGPLARLIPSWQFLGSFYWVRNDDFFTRAWRDVSPGYYAAEVWPGFHFRSDEAACCFYSVGPRVRLNDLAYLEREVEPVLAAWEGRSCT